MSCHVVLPYEWVECANGDACRSLIHYEGSEEELNSYPQEWLSELLGFSVDRGENPISMCFTDADGEVHRVDGPALEDKEGTLGWYTHGRLHRVDGPAITASDGRGSWYKDGVLHRTDVCVMEHVDSKGVRQWSFYGVHESFLYRFGSPPAVLGDGSVLWVVRNVLNDNSYPTVSVVEHVDGYVEWFENTIRVRAKSVTSCDGCGWFDCRR